MSPARAATVTGSIPFEISRDTKLCRRSWQVALLSVLGLAEGDTLTEAGAWGVLAAVFLIALLAVPQIVGIVLGVKARRLGER